MKSQQQEQARELYLQTNLSKTEIAEKLSVNRRTIYQWSVDGDWEVLRKSARCMPSILAQKVYHLIGHFTDNILCRDAAYQSITKDEVNILTKLVNAVTKLKSGSTASENMETFTMFLEGLKVKDAFLAEELLPHVDDFVTANATQSHKSFILDGHNQDGTKPFPEKDLLEKWQDEKDYDTIVAEINNTEPPKERTYVAPEESNRSPKPFPRDSYNTPTIDTTPASVPESVGGRAAMPCGSTLQEEMIIPATNLAAA